MSPVIFDRTWRTNAIAACVMQPVAQVRGDDFRVARDNEEVTLNLVVVEGRL